jgi:hypothetical protein
MKIEYKEDTLQVSDDNMSDAEILNDFKENCRLIDMDSGIFTDKYPDITFEDLIITRESYETNKNSKVYLSSTDWYVTRKLETGVEIPVEITAKRQAARESISAKPN